MSRIKSGKDRVHIYMYKLNGKIKSVSGRHVIFENRVCYNIFEDRIEFHLANIDSYGASINPKHNKSGWYNFNIAGAEEVPVGSFLIDEEESNEDVVIIYFEDKLN